MNLSTKFSIFRFACILIGASFSATMLTAQSEQEIMAKAQQLLQSQSGWDEKARLAQLNGEAHFRFEKIGDETQESKHATRYRVFVEGAKTNLEYEIYIMNLYGQLQQIPGKFYANSKGLLLPHLPTKEQLESVKLPEADEVETAVVASKGEPIRYALTNAASKTLIFGTLIPFPLVTEAGSCHLELRRSLPNAEAVLLYVTGASPNSTIAGISNSEGETHPIEIKIDSNGHGMSAILPGVTGKDAGTVTETFSTKDCTGSISIAWGKGAYKVE